METIIQFPCVSLRVTVTVYPCSGKDPLKTSRQMEMHLKY